MSDIDERLKKLQLSPIDNYGEYWTLSDEDVAQIKQAFADEGYVQMPQVEMITRFESGKKPELFMVNGKEVMTGREWYERFEKELGEPQTFAGYGYDSVGYDEDDVLAAAKRASGVEEQV